MQSSDMICIVLLFQYSEGYLLVLTKPGVVGPVLNSVVTDFYFNSMMLFLQIIKTFSLRNKKIKKIIFERWLCPKANYEEENKKKQTKHMGQHPMTVKSPYPCHNFSKLGELLSFCRVASFKTCDTTMPRCKRTSS